MGYNPQESLENTINTMGTLLGVDQIVPWTTRNLIFLVRDPERNQIICEDCILGGDHVIMSLQTHKIWDLCIAQFTYID